MILFKNKEIRNRLLVTLSILVIFYIGMITPLPYAYDSSIGDNNLFSLLNLVSGGALSRKGLFLLGVSPIIASSIVMQLGKKVFNSWEKLSKTVQGEMKLSRIQRLFTILFAFSQSYVFIFTEVGSLIGFNLVNDFYKKLSTMLLIILGAIIIEFLSKKIDRFGFGQGASVLIAFGLLGNLIVNSIGVYTLKNVYEQQDNLSDYWKYLSILVVSFIFISIVSYIANKKEFKVPVQSMRNTATFEAHYLPIKLLASSVMPIIVVTSLQSLVSMFNSLYNLGIDAYLSYTTKKGLVIYILMIFVFTFLYNYVQLNGEDIAKNLNESSAYVLGVNPNEVERYINRKVFKVTLIGAPVLTLIATFSLVVELMLPDIFGMSLVGVASLIIIGVFSELIRQIRGLVIKNVCKEMIV